MEEEDVIVCRGSGCASGAIAAAEAEDAWKLNVATPDARAATLPPAFWRKDRRGLDDDDDVEDEDCEDADVCGDEIERAWQWQRLQLLARSLFAVSRTTDDAEKKAAARRFPMFLILKQSSALLGSCLYRTGLLPDRSVDEQSSERIRAALTDVRQLRSWARNHERNQLFLVCPSIRFLPAQQIQKMTQERDALNPAHGRDTMHA